MHVYQLLEKKLGFDTPLPVDENWAAAEDFLHIISDFCLQEKPEVIAECSSGISSLVLSRCCQINHLGHVYSLENGEDFVRQTQQQLESYSLDNFCDVIHAPLQDIVLHDEHFQWYGLGNFPVSGCGEKPGSGENCKIDMLVIDGPPGFLQKNSRYPALPMLMDKLAGSCTVFLDDAAREDEKTIVELWLKQYPEFQLEYIDNERGCSILRR